MNIFLRPYTSWQIAEDTFPQTGTIEEQIRFFLGYGVLAPSTFNAQPWKCQIGKNSLIVYLDVKRMPTKSDKSGRFGHISVGCFIENICIAADHFGFSSNVTYADKSVKRNGYKLSELAVITFVKQANKSTNQLFPFITKRNTNRTHFHSKLISKNILGAMQKVALPHQQLVCLDETSRDLFIKISSDADIAIWSDRSFRKEHVSWVRSNITLQKDGMPGIGVGVKLIPSLLARPVILSNKFARLQAMKNKGSLQHTNQFMIFFSKDDPIEWVKLGRTYERTALFALKHGISLAPMGQFIEDDTARKKLKKFSKSSLLPQMFVRIGYPTDTSIHHSPRIPVQEIIL